MEIDWTISLGSILQLLGFIAGGISFAMVLKSDVKVLTIRVSSVESSMKAISDILPVLARQDERLQTHTGRITEIERDLRDFIMRRGSE